jgi:hypothetical protein
MLSDDIDFILTLCLKRILARRYATRVRQGSANPLHLHLSAVSFFSFSFGTSSLTVNPFRVGETVRGDAPESDDKYAHKRKQKVPVRIPRKVIEKAEGLAIFTVWRTGFGFSAASGSGVVIARDSPTSWGPPSGILLVAFFVLGFSGLLTKSTITGFTQ